jgi:hypothetical protein
VRDALTTLGELLGALIFSFGAYLAWHPLGFMVLGALLIAACLVVAL